MIPEKTESCVACLDLNHSIPKLHYKPLCRDLGTAHAHHRIGGNFEAFLGNQLFAAAAEAVAVLGDALEGVGDALELLLLTAAQLEGHLLVRCAGLDANIRLQQPVVYLAQLVGGKQRLLCHRFLTAGDY